MDSSCFCTIWPAEMAEVFELEYLMVFHTMQGGPCWWSGEGSKLLIHNCWLPLQTRSNLSGILPRQCRHVEAFQMLHGALSATFQAGLLLAVAL